MPKIGQYIFRLERGWWTIYVVTSTFSNEQASGYGYTQCEHEPQFPIEEREAARKRVYELNGWNYRPAV